MQLLSSGTIPDHIKNIIHEDTQLHSQRIDLTVKSIQRTAKAGSLDFGGSEFEAAGMETIPAAKRNADDDYGWWKLDAGIYRAQFNEELSMPDNVAAIITPHDHAQDAALLAGTDIVAESGSIGMLFQVPGCGCNIKENARIATALLFKY
jgi:deoxycytidine triphosphate deaminase